LTVVLRSALKRGVPLLVLALAAVLIVFLRPETEFLLAEIAEHRAGLAELVLEHRVVAVLVFAGIYLLTKTLFVPTGPLLTAAGGLFLGVTTTTVAGSVAGAAAASILYAVADFGLGRSMRARAIPFMERIATGFRRYGFSYLVAFRLVPLVPFWAGCFVPAILGVPFGTYLAATLVGSLPSILIYASLGHGLGLLLDQGSASLDTFSRPDVALPLFGLAVLSLAPVLWSKLRERRERTV
jgi:uncharacterized membrane protein YdjX (TVP38/TMEM64 family)